MSEREEMTPSIAILLRKGPRMAFDAAERVVSVPDPTDAAADGLHHRYASVGSGDTGNNFVANQVGISSCPIRLQQCNN